uniref:Putative secreted protein n=1 Tax=Anopheles marajoara TaxID=58244 RepID=A0A2M4C9V2_9DIPT
MMSHAFMSLSWLCLRSCKECVSLLLTAGRCSLFWTAFVYPRSRDTVRASGPPPERITFRTACDNASENDHKRRSKGQCTTLHQPSSTSRVGV